MTRYILIDNASGYIWGDSADLDGEIWNGDFVNADGEDDHDASPIGFARALDRSVDASAANNRTYETVSRSALASNETGYHVYRADIGGSDAVMTIQDGQDQEMIEAVERDCEYVTTIRINDNVNAP
jgi:hypothetical protein